MAGRDRWIGWEDWVRGENLQLIVNQSPFLILPWVDVPNLSSHVLGHMTARMAIDRAARYGYRPALVDLGEKRLHRRLQIIAGDFFALPTMNLPQACGNRAKVKAVYRFLDQVKGGVGSLWNGCLGKGGSGLQRGGRAGRGRCGGWRRGEGCLRCGPCG